MAARLGYLVLIGTLLSLCEVMQAQVDGGWSEWDDLVCECGDAEMQGLRIRRCNNPPRDKDGKQCPGLPYEVVNLGENCGNDSCFQGPVQWTPWFTLNPDPCPVTCGGGRVNETRIRFCFGGDICKQPQRRVRSIPCGNISCPVNGRWSSWSSWITPPCPVSCGAVDSISVNRTRTRVCDNPTPQGEGTQCQGPDKMIEVITCGREPCVGNGSWTSWSPWITPPCPVSCGAVDGVSVNRTRTRVCNNPKPQGGGTQCQGPDKMLDAITCGRTPCAGEWTSWGEWGMLQCSATCGGSMMGISTRSRTCSRPEGHTKCSGGTEETRRLVCKLGDCPGNTTRSQWYDHLSEDARRAIIVIIVAVGVFFIILITVFIVLLCRNRRKRLEQPHPQPPVLKEGLNSGTASRSTFKEGSWQQAFDDTSQSS